MASERAKHCTVSAAGSSMKGQAEVEEEMVYLPSLHIDAMGCITTG
jgi:hypothetical protein